MWLQDGHGRSCGARVDRDGVLQVILRAISKPHNRLIDEKVVVQRYERDPRKTNGFEDHPEKIIVHRLWSLRGLADAPLTAFGFRDVDCPDEHVAKIVPHGSSAFGFVGTVLVDMDKEPFQMMIAFEGVEPIAVHILEPLEFPRVGTDSLRVEILAKRARENRP